MNFNWFFYNFFIM